MWNPNQAVTNSNSHEESDSWEVKAFAKDTANVLGTTWPPQSYNCTFCGREFRSAQALGGHMNVHRRDRARLHQAHPNLSASTSTSSPLFIPTHQQLVANGGLCLLYSLPNTNSFFTPSSLHNGLSFPHSFNSEASPPTNYKTNQKLSLDKKRKKTDSTVEGTIDLELRLGCSSSAS